MIKFIMPKIHIRIERWKWNEEYRAYVSNLGRVKDENKKVITPYTTRNGYLKILSNKKWVSLHRLVMGTWCPCKDEDNLTIDHLDHNKRNNSIYNLEWVSREENLKRAEEDRVVNAESPLVSSNGSFNKSVMVSFVDDNGKSNHLVINALSDLYDIHKYISTFTIDTKKQKQIILRINNKYKTAISQESSNGNFRYFGLDWEIIS